MPRREMRCKHRARTKTTKCTCCVAGSATSRPSSGCVLLHRQLKCPFDMIIKNDPELLENYDAKGWKEGHF
jgi:hypothetical protein